MTFHPCGVVMDMVRSCYRTTFNFGNGVVAEGQWFFTAPGAAFFPGLNRFGSLNWLPGPIPDDGVGEVLGAPRPWANGSYPVVPNGTAPDGPLEDFTTGNNPASPPLTLNPNGIPLTCVPDPGGEYDSSYAPAFNT